MMTHLTPFTMAQIGGAQWSLGFEGISPGWALLLLAAFVGGTVWAYLRYSTELPAWRRWTMAGLRIAAALVFVVLVTKPILNLTVNEKVPQSLLVLLDASQSMATQDRRDLEPDLKRAALATGDLDPRRGLDQNAPASATAASLKEISRWELLRQLAANETLDLWPRLREHADLSVFRLGRNAAALGSLEPLGARKLTAERAAEFFGEIQPTETATALGDGLAQVLRESRSRPTAGVLLITDGQSNAGAPALEAAQAAREQNVPLYIYGVGVTSPPDVILQDVIAQRLAFLEERVTVTARIRTQGLSNQLVTGTLSVDGAVVDEQSVTAGEEGTYELAFSFIPSQAGETVLEVNLPLLPEETGRENNTATRKLRVTDQKFNVLFIEQEPRWDFRYLLDYLVRDRRLEVRCAVIDGEPNLEKVPDSPFLAELPSDRESFFQSQVLILGDVSPDDLGQERMQIIKEWVEAGGGIIFLAGPSFNPGMYAETPLEALLPVVPDTISPKEWTAQREPEPFKLQLTALGENSPYLRMDQDEELNRDIWATFPGVRWTAPLARVKPGAEVLLVDPRMERMGRYGMLPVFAMQTYGAGRSVYLGTDETYRWRSRTGEKYYSILWGQIMQSLALQLLEGGSARTQLKTDRPEYMTGDTVTISGRAYTDGFEPLIAPNLEGRLTAIPAQEIGGDGSSGATPVDQPLNLSALADQSGFRAQFMPSVPGEYEFTTPHDPDAVVRFTVVEPRLEQTETALNERLLKAMAQAGGGRFFREENLHELPDLLEARSVTTASFKKLEIYHSPWWMAALFLLVFGEWLLRRLSQLK